MTPEHWLLADLLLGLVAQGVALLRLARHVRGLERIFPPNPKRQKPAK
jgi:hypothetical protein